jgi:hypothetical protein
MFFRYQGLLAAKRVGAQLSAVRQRYGEAIRAEIVVEVSAQGRVHVRNPGRGAITQARSSLISWGLCGLGYGTLAGLTSGGGVLASFGGGVTSLIGWGVCGAGAGYLYGYLTGRAISTEQLKRLGTLLKPDTLVVSAWVAGAEAQRQMAEDFSTPDAEALTIRIDRVAGGRAVLQVA